jgi:hypothetical protein
MWRRIVLIRRLLPGKTVMFAAWHASHATHGGVIVFQTENRGEMGSAMGG